MNTPSEIGKERKLSHKEKLLLSLIGGFLFATFFIFVEDFDFNSSQSWFDYFFRLIFFGLFFGYGFDRMTKLLGARVHFTKPARHQAFELCIAKGPANCFYGWEAVGGELFITNEDLVFVPHGLNIQMKVLEIPLEEIKQIRAKKTLNLLNNGIRIKTDQKHYNFVLNERYRWIELLEKTTVSSQH